MADVRRYLFLGRQQLLAEKRYSTMQIYFDVDPL
jgi:primosomal protein N' (replication factor Y)